MWLFWLLASSLHWLRVGGENAPVLLVVLDGFRHDYLSAYSTPNLDRVVRKGVLVPSLEPEFPAARDPFLVSLLSGVHSADHGIFANQIFWESSQKIETLDEPKVWKAALENISTIWDLEAKFCTCNWPHAQHLDLPQENVIGVTLASPPPPRPEIKEGPNVTSDKVTETSSTQSSAASLEQPWGLEKWGNCIDAIIPRLMEGQARFASVFADEPGQTAMTFGPESEEVAKAVAAVDEAIGQLLDRLEASELWPEKLNLIVTSSPGYAPLPSTHLINLSTMVDASLFQAVGESPVLNIRPLSKELFVYEELRKGEKQSPFKVFIKEEFPSDWHYASNPNVQELIVVADQGYAFSHDMKDRMKELDTKANRTLLSLKNTYGLSGYNNSLSDMQSLVILQGPDLAGQLISPADKATEEHPSSVVRVVDLFVLLCNLLEVKSPTAVAGDLARVQHLLRYPSDTEVVKVIRSWMALALMPENVPITIAVGLTSLTLILVLFVSIIRCCCCRRGSKQLAAANYRYTQVKTNRRPPGQDIDGVHFEGMSDDKQRLLTEVPINDEDEEVA